MYLQGETPKYIFVLFSLLFPITMYLVFRCLKLVSRLFVSCAITTILLSCSAIIAFMIIYTLIFVLFGFTEDWTKVNDILQHVKKVDVTEVITLIKRYLKDISQKIFEMIKE